MPIEGIGSNARPMASDVEASEQAVPTGTGEELIGSVIAMLDEQHARQREARQAAREVRREAAEARIGALRTEADLQFAAGVASGVAQAAGGACQAAGTASAASTNAEPNPAGIERPAVDPNWAAAGKMVEGAGTLTSSTFNLLAAGNHADAEAHEVAETAAGDAAQDMSDAMEQTERLANRAVDHLEATLQAQVDARRAAIRG